MKMQALAGAAVLALIAGGASAATHKHAATGKFAEPSQPIAYSKLDSYLKASPRAKASGAWGLDTTATASAAPTGTSANTSATAQPPAATPGAAAGAQDNSQAGMMPPAAAPPAGDAAGSAAMPPAQAPPATQTPPEQMGAPADQQAPSTSGAAPSTAPATPGQ